MSIDTKVIELVNLIYGSECCPDDILEEMGGDSLDQVELAMAIEEEFDVEFNDETVVNWVTVANIINDTIDLVNE